MTELRFDIDWNEEHYADPILDQTTAEFKITLGDVCLTENVDVWSEVKRDAVLVSVYPLAMWMASSWWRLHHEVLPTRFGVKPPRDWRLSHEMTAANEGYVWPLVVFSTDRKVMNIWAEQFPPNRGHSVRYLSSHNAAASVPMSSFTRTCREFIEQVLDRLTSKKCTESDLSQLWSLVLADLSDPLGIRNRRIEAQFGFDPEACPEDLLAGLRAIEDDKGEDVLAELAAVRSLQDANGARSIQKLFEAPGIEVQPELPELPAVSTPAEPWQQAKADAAALRREIAAGDATVTNDILADLLGVCQRTLEEQSDFGFRPAAIAGRIDDHRMRFVPQKRHPFARRFEWARLVGGYVDAIVRDGHSWLASTEARTVRQKYQRAFAAEFLCPIKLLYAFLDGDFSESKMEDAAAEFGVSDWTVSRQLINNQLLPRQDGDFGCPYSMVT